MCNKIVILRIKIENQFVNFYLDFLWARQFRYIRLDKKFKLFMLYFFSRLVFGLLRKFPLAIYIKVDFYVFLGGGGLYCFGYSMAAKLVFYLFNSYSLDW